MSDLRRRWFGNSAVNLIGGVATAGVNVLLPAIVVKHLSADAFSVWNLALQMLVYVNLLGLGLQTAVARAVAHSVDSNREQSHSPEVILSAARSLARRAATIGVATVLILVVAYPWLFPDLPTDLLAGFRWTLLLFGLAAVAQILAQVDMGVFQGLHRNRVFVAVQMLVRTIAVIAVWLGATAGAPLVVLALLMALVSAMLWPAMALVSRRAVPWFRAALALSPDRACRRELLKYCGTLSVWSLSMMLINSVGIVIVGRMDFMMAGPYAIAMTASSVLVGLMGAALSPLMTTSAALYASESTRQRLPALLARSTLCVAIGLSLLVIGVEAFHPQILRLWVGQPLVEPTAPLLITLVGAYCLRNVAAPYSLMLLATGLHQRALVSAVLEGGANLSASIVLGIAWGAMGVAYGSLVGSIVGIAGTLWLNASRTPELITRPYAFTLKSVVLPLLFFAPIHFYLLKG